MPAKKRKGPKHPGVTILKEEPERRVPHRVRYIDPDLNRMVKKVFPAHVKTLEQREQYAVLKSKELTIRKMELAKGAARATGTSLADALEKYYAAHKILNPGTVSIYRRATQRLIKWAAGPGKIKTADDLTRPKLMEFRTHIVNAPKLVAQAGEKPGTYAPTDEQRGANTINQDLRSTRTVLGYVRDLDLLPRLTHDDLRIALKRVGVDHDEIDFLKGAEIKGLLNAATKHDAQKFKLTAAEHDRLKPIGTTARFDPIAPFTLFVLLSGTRIGEALGLQWEDVDLDAVDMAGNKSVEIKLGPAATKTRRGRTIYLDVSPALQALLAKMKPKVAAGSIFRRTPGMAKRGLERLRVNGAPDSVTWHVLRATCGTYLTNAPGIYGAASAYRSAKQLGHSITVAEKHYLGLVRGIPATAKTLEAAMGVEKLAQQIINWIPAPGTLDSHVSPTAYRSRPRKA